MNKKLNDISFWKQVKQEYLGNVWDFICNSSPVFQQFYGAETNRRALNTLAHKFLEERNKKHLVNPWTEDGSNTVLFNVVNSSNDRKLREQFINWNIRRLSKKST